MSAVAAASIALADAPPETLVVTESATGPRFPNGIVVDNECPGGIMTSRLGDGGPTSLPLAARRWWDPSCPVGTLDRGRIQAFLVSIDPLELPYTPEAGIGWGPGLTPAGDDLVLGMLVGFHAAGARGEATALAEACASAETVPLSRALLDHAAGGRAVRPVLDLVAALSGRRELNRAIADLRCFGATSGRYILDGLRRGLAASPLPSRETVG